MKELFTKVYNTLVKFPESRDNDRFLTMCIWNLEDSNLKGSQYSDFQKSFLSDNLTLPHIIVAVKYKIQDKYVSLQGKSYLSPTERKKK